MFEYSITTICNESKPMRLPSCRDILGEGHSHGSSVVTIAVAGHQVHENGAEQGRITLHICFGANCQFAARVNFGPIKVSIAQECFGSMSIRDLLDNSLDFYSFSRALTQG